MYESGAQARDLGWRYEFGSGGHRDGSQSHEAKKEEGQRLIPDTLQCFKHSEDEEEPTKETRKEQPMK